MLEQSTSRSAFTGIPDGAHSQLGEESLMPRATSEVGIRWTIGDVNREGFEALRLSMWGAWKIFGSAARYAVFVNSVAIDNAREWTGESPHPVEWHAVSRKDLPGFLSLGSGMAEGTGWKFCPVRAFEGLPELALDNDCILWSMPRGMERWLERGNGALIAEDVRAHFGAFASRCGDAPRNSGIRGLAADFPFAESLSEVLDGAVGSSSARLETEGDEQGLQVAAIYSQGQPELVSLDEVTICSPFPPHLRELGRCGVHFVGLNTRNFGWTYCGRNPVEVTREHWRSMKEAVSERVFS